MFMLMTRHSIGTWDGKVPTHTHMGQSFTGHTITPAQMTQLYHPPLHGQNPP